MTQMIASVCRRTSSGGIPDRLRRRGPGLRLCRGFGRAAASATRWPPASSSPTAWYSIAPDGKVTVMVGKAEMGQHVSSAMAQIVAEELEADWRMMNIAAGRQRSQVQRSRSGGADHRRLVERAHELRRDEPGGRRRAHHADRCGCCHDGRAGQRVPRQQQPGHPHQDRQEGELRQDRRRTARRARCGPPTS